MLKFLSAKDVGRMVRGVGLRRFWPLLIDYLREDFSRWERFEKSPRLASHSRDGVIELMPTSDGRLYGLKYVTGHPGNAALGLQTVAAFGVLADVATGYPALLADMTLATALRTAAVSALAAQHLARPDARTMALIGLGAQSEFQACAFQATLGIDRLRIFDIDAAAADKFERNMDGLGLAVARCANAQEATVGADVVTTITADKRQAHILSGNMIGAGTHINAVGGDCPGKTELSRDLLLRADIFVEFAPQTRLEGELQQLAADHPVTEFWEVVSGRKQGRVSRAQITLFDSVGFAVEDFSALRLLNDLARDMRLGEEIDFLAAPENPKDSLSLLREPEDAFAQRCA